MIDLDATSDVLGDGTLAASMAKTGSSSAATTGGLSPFAAGGLSLRARDHRQQNQWLEQNSPLGQRRGQQIE